MVNMPNNKPAEFYAVISDFWNKVTACMCAPIYSPKQNDTEDGRDDCTVLDWECMQPVL